MQALHWIGEHGCLVVVLGIFVLVPIVGIIFRAGRARAFRCPKCGFSNVAEVVKNQDDDED